MLGLTYLDLFALGWFLIAWGVHAATVERSEWRKRSLNYRMDLSRREWMLKMLDRDVRLAGLSGGCYHAAQISCARSVSPSWPSELSSMTHFSGGPPSVAMRLRPSRLAA